MKNLVTRQLSGFADDDSDKNDNDDSLCSFSLALKNIVAKATYKRRYSIRLQSQRVRISNSRVKQHLRAHILIHSCDAERQMLGMV